MQQKRDTLLKQLNNPIITWLPCQGAYFLVADIGQITQKSDADFAIDLTVEKGLATIPLSAFSKQTLPGKYLRFCFAKNDDTLYKAAQILNQLT
jgi:methionine aminotransferase